MTSNLNLSKNMKTTSKFICVVFSFFAFGCNSTMPGTASNTTTSEAPSLPPVVTTPPVVADMCTAPVTKVVDYGERSTTGTVMGLRGAFSDIGLIPTLNYPAYVFTDAGSLTLKYQYWDGTKYNMEIIDAGLTYNFVKLVFLSTGRPLVFWSNGATAIYMASRNSASTTTSSAWTVSALDNVTLAVTRAVEVSVSGSDQVGVFYVNSTNTSARVLLCNANCETASNYGSMGVAANFINGTASASTNSADIKWCNTGTGYIPYVAYGSTGANSLVSRCTQTTLSNCLTPANWASVAITDGTNATGTNQVMTKLAIADTANSSFMIAARRGGADIRAYRQTIGQGCATGTLTVSTTPAAATIITSATVGNSYGNLQQDSSGRYHLVVNDGTTGMRYLNELTGVITAAWNNTVGVIETTTLPAIAAMRGGMVVDEASDQILYTYGRTNAGTPTHTISNVVLGYTNCPVGGTGCGASTLASPASAAGLSFGNSPLDATGQIQLPTGQMPNVVSLATTSTGRPAVAFIDFSAGAATTGRLKYRIRSGNLTSDVWLLSDIGTATSPQAVSMAFDHTDRPWIAYYDANSLRYFLVTNTQIDGSGIWMQYQFPIANATAATLPAVNNVALTMSTVGAVKTPMMVVSNSGAATKVIRAALFDPSTETWSNNKLLDTGVANFSKLAIDSDSAGNIALAYFDTTNSTIKMTATSNAGGTWLATAAVITSVGGQGLDLKINPINNRPAVSFYDRANNLVRYKYCNTALASCANSLSWVNLGTGIVEGAAGVSTLVSTTTDGLLSSALTFTNEGYPGVVYSMGSTSTTGHLVYNSVSAASIFFGLPSNLNLAQNSITATPLASTPANFGLGGWNPNSVRSTATGSLHTAYVGPGNYLYVTSCGN